MTNANTEGVEYGYNAAGDLLTLTDGKNQTVTFHADQYGRVTNKVDQVGTEIIRYTYDLDNRMTNRWTASKGNTAYTYDNVGNLTLINYPVSHDVTFGYDAMNRLTSMIDGVGTNVFTYTTTGQLLSEDGPFASDTLTNGYSNRFRTGLGLQQPTGVWTNGFSYDWAGRYETVSSRAGTFTYYRLPGAQSLISGVALPNLSFITNFFDGNARLTATYLETSFYTVLDSATYGYNGANQRTNFTDTAASVQYSYDNIGQLKIAASSASTESRGYTYDHAWNLNWLTNNGSAYHFLPDSKNELTNAYSATYTFDANGNVTSGTNGHTSYVYDDENRLIQWFWYAAGSGICSNGALRTDFSYDGLGRLRKRVEYSATNSAPPPGPPGVPPPDSPGCSWSLGPETDYIYDGRRVIQERDGNNNLEVSYTLGPDLSGTLEGAGGIGGLLARSDQYSSGNPTRHNYYHADSGGNVTYMVNNSQGLAASYRYDAFGNTISSSGTLAPFNVYRFSSKELHANSGMYHFLYRFYDPRLQRWLNRDPIGEEGGINLYGFVGNNPANEVDPFGLAGAGEEDFEDEITREILNELREQWARNGRYVTDRDLVRMEDQIEQNTRRDREKFEENPPYLGSEPIMRPLVPKGRPQTGKPGPTPSRVCQDPKNAPITDPARLLSPPKRVPRDPFHHLFPRRPDLASQFRARGINPDDFTLQVPKPIHLDMHSGGPRGGDWNQAWEDFFSANPNATALEIYIHAGNLMYQFQVPGGPIVPYRR